MQSRSRSTGMMSLAVLAMVAAAVCSPIAPAEGRPLEIDVWTSRGEDGAVCTGEPVDVCFETTKRARVIVYAIDTEGWVHILYPIRAWESESVRSGRTYRITGSQVERLSAGPDGIVVIGAVAARGRLPVGRWLDDGEMAVFCGDDYRVVAGTAPERWVIGRVVGDPFKAVWAIEDALIPAGIGADDYAGDLCWLSVDPFAPRPRCIVIGSRRRWECDPRFHVVFDFGGCFDWPLVVVRADLHRVWGRGPADCGGPACDSGRPSCPAPLPSPAAQKWKEERVENSKKEWNQTAKPSVLRNEGLKVVETLVGGSKSDPGEGSKSRESQKKSTSVSNKSKGQGYSDQNGKSKSSDRGAAGSEQAGKPRKK